MTFLQFHLLITRKIFEDWYQTVKKEKWDKTIDDYIHKDIEVLREVKNDHKWRYIQ